MSNRKIIKHHAGSPERALGKISSPTHTRVVPSNKKICGVEIQDSILLVGIDQTRKMTAKPSTTNRGKV